MLLLSSYVRRHDAFHRVVGPFVAVASDTGDPFRQPVSLGRAGRFERREIAHDVGRELLSKLRAEGLQFPLRLDGGRDLVGWDVRQIAAGSAGVAACAHEVVVAVTTAAGGDVQEQPRATAGAVHGAGQEVLVAVGPLAGLTVRNEDALHFFERLSRHVHRVLAGVLDAAPGDKPDVVAVRQYVMQLVGGQRPRRAFGRWALRQAARLQFGRQTVQAVVASGVGLEGPLDVLGPLDVDGDGAGLRAIGHATDVQVADRRDVRRTAGRDLLLRALDDLVGQVARVELGDRTHDPVQQRAARRLVDVLGDADQLRAGRLDLCRDRHVVEAVACEAVDLVHDDVLDGLGREVGQHPLELGPIRRAGGLAALNEHLGHGGAQRLGALQTCFALGRDRVAVGVAVTVELILGADANVDQRTARSGSGNDLQGSSHGVAPRGVWLRRS